MDLSKIPEPSEDDLKFASISGPYGMLVHEYEQTLAVLQESREHELTVMILAAEALLQKIRVIAHLLRHGSVLAEAMLEELPGLIQDVPIDDPAWGNVLAAIRFFMKIRAEGGSRCG